MTEDSRGVVTPPFPDRQTAGRLLGEVLALRLGGGETAPERERTLVVALPRGGVAVADEVARLLGAPMDVLVTRKIGYPPQPELGVGAIVEGADPVYDAALLARLGLRAEDLSAVAARERTELDRRVRVYRGDRPPPPVQGRQVILVDDGLATGVTARAALRGLRARGARRTVLAVPVAPRSSVDRMRREADDVVALVTPTDFRSVGEWYTSFGQLSDEDVLALLDHARRRACRPKPSDPPGPADTAR